MSDHASRRRFILWRALRSARLRALLCLGILLGIGSVGTLAYWSDSATVAGGTFQAGTLNIRVNGQEGNPTPYTWTAFSLNTMVPGESWAASIPIQNVGSTDFTFTATATAILAGGNPAGSLSDMTFQTYVGGSASNTTTAGLRTGSCSGTSQGAAVSLGSSATTVIGTAQAVGATTGTQTVCVVATLKSSAPNADQGQSVTATYVFNAKQIGAP